MRRGSSSKGSSISSSGNWGSWEKTSGKTSISCWAKSSELSRPLGSGSLSFKSSEESSLSFSNLGSVNNRGSSVDGGNWESSVVNRGNREAVRGNSESEVISNIVDSVNSSLISIGVRSGDTSKSVSLLLLGRVDVLVSVSKVTDLILSLELRADWASNRGSKRSSGNSNWGSSISSRGSGNSDRWGVSSSILSSNNGGSSSKSRSSSNGASSEGTSVNSSCNWGSISSSIRSSITICSVIKTSTSQVLSSDRKLSLGGSSGKDGRNNSKELHGVTSLLCV